METTLDKFGRVVLPKQVRDSLGLEAGSVLRIEQAPGEIRLTPVEEKPSLVWRDGLLVFVGEIEGDLDDVVRRQREERLKKLIRG